jgi:hypothetical protein
MPTVKTKTIEKDGKSWTLRMPKAQTWLDAIEGSGIFEIEGRTLTAYTVLADPKITAELHVHAFNALIANYVAQKVKAHEVDTLKLRIVAGMNDEQIADLDLDDQAFVVGEINQWLPGEVVGEWPPKVRDITSPASTDKRLLISVPEPTPASSTPLSSSGGSSSSLTDGLENPGKKNSSSPTTNSTPSP